MPTVQDKKFTRPLPPQEQEMPGSQEAMRPQPLEVDCRYKAAKKLQGKVAIITGGDSGIGRSVALLFAKEGADVCLVYLSEHEDAEITAEKVRDFGGRAIQ